MRIVSFIRWAYLLALKTGSLPSRGAWIEIFIAGCVLF